MELKHVSLTRLVGLVARWRNCRPLIGSDATASLYGADKLLQEPGARPRHVRVAREHVRRREEDEELLLGARSRARARASRRPRRPTTRTTATRAGTSSARSTARSRARRSRTSRPRPAGRCPARATRLPGARPRPRADGAALLAAAQAAVDAAEAHAAVGELRGAAVGDRQHVGPRVRRADPRVSPDSPVSGFRRCTPPGAPRGMPTTRPNVARLA